MEFVHRNHLVLRDRRSPSADAETGTDPPSFDLVAAVLVVVVVSAEGWNAFVGLDAIVLC